MKIARIRIQNYRSIKDCTLHPGDLCALIGGNNTGKSNILRAINLVLGERWPSSNSIDDRDYFQYKTDEDIAISVWFDETQEVHGDIGKPGTVHGIQFRVSRYKRASGKHVKGDPKVEFLCIDENGDVVTVLRRPNANAKPYPQPARVTSPIRESVPAVFIDVDRSSTYHLSGAPRSILGRLLTKVSKAFKSDKDAYGEFRQRFEAAREILRTDEFVELESTVVEQLKAHTGLDNVDVFLDEVDPINVYRTFSVLFQDEMTKHPVDAERMGSGIQSAVVISLLQAYREISKENAVLLFEEPELFLHAHGRRHLFRLLTELKQAGTQVIYTTHSQDLVDLEQLDFVHLVNNTKDDGTMAHIPDDSILPKDWRERLRIAKHFGGSRNEVFFADSVVLVEGVTEQAAIRVLADVFPDELRLDMQNCSIIEAGGKSALPLMISVLAALGKPMLVVYDTDSHHEGDGAIATAKLNESIGEECESAGAMSLTFDPYLEAEVGIEGDSKKKKDRKMREFLSELGSWADTPQPLKTLLENVARRCGAIE